MNADESFAQYVEARWELLVRAAVLMGRSRADAEDLVQTTLAKLFVHWKRVTRANNVDSYVYAALFNQSRSSSRRRWRGELAVEAVPEAARAQSSDVDEVLVVQQALSRLTPEHRAVVVTRHFLDLTEADSAAVLAIPVGTVKSRLARALANLGSDPQLRSLSQDRSQA